MKLLNGYILVRVDKPQEKTKTGILLAEKTVKLPSQGTVEAVADGIDEVKPGDRIEFLRYAAIDGTEEDTRLCRREHIIGVYEG